MICYSTYCYFVDAFDETFIWMGIWNKCYVNKKLIDDVPSMYVLYVINELKAKSV
jgi:hypothetical protein